MKESPIAKLEDFIRKHCRKELGRVAGEYPEKKSLYIDFGKLEKFDPELADALLESPHELLSQAGEAIKHIDLPIEGEWEINARILGIPEEKNILIRNLRSEHIGKLVTVEGIVRTASDVRPQALMVNFECPICQTEVPVEQTEARLIEPFQCTNPNCGRKGKFKIKNIKFIDSTRIRLQEPPEAIIGSEQPATLYIELRDDLVAPKERKKILPGNSVKINGVLREYPLKPGMTKYDIYLEGNYVETTEMEYEEIELTKEDVKEIEDTAKELDIYNKLIDSISPSIYGYREIKEAILLQLFGGVRKVHPDGTTIRGDIHIFLVGDPGTGKCVSGDTEILLSDGSLKRIGEEDIKPSGSVDDGTYAHTNHDLLALGFSGKNVETKADIFWKRRSPTSMYNICTQSGREICVSPTHPVFVCEDGAIAAKRASELRKGTFISTPRQLPVFGRPQPLSVEYKRSSADNAARLKLPAKTSPEFWRFIALLICEGYVQVRGDKYPLGTMYFTNNDLLLLSEVSDYCKKLGLKPTTRQSHKGKSAKEVYACGIEFCSFLESLGLKTLSAGKDVPDLLFKCSKEEIAAFLSGLFDAEGTVSKREREISIISASRELIRHTKHLLLRFGIASQYQTTQKRATNSSGPLRTYHLLRISGEDIVTFDKEIGFRCAVKAERLKRIKSPHNTNLDVIPSVGDLIRRTRLALDLHQRECGVSQGSMNHYEHEDRNPSVKALKKIVAAFEKGYGKITPSEPVAEDISRLKTLSESDIYWDKVVSVKKTKPESQWVYDLQVPTHHNFVANDIYVHNSQILRYVAQLAPKGKYVSGKGASGAGLTASAIKDEVTGSWILEAGALVLANLGVACLLPDSKVIIDNKIRSIESLFDRGYTAKSNGESVEICEIEGNVPSLEKGKLATEVKKATTVRKRAYAGEILEITFQSGMKIRVTPTHKLVCGKTLEWRDACEFSEGDRLVGPLKLPANHQDMYFLDVLPDDWIISLDKNEKTSIKKKILERFKTISEFNRKYGISRHVLFGGKQFKIGKFKQILRDFDLYEEWKKQNLSFGRVKKAERLKTSKITPELAYFLGFVYGDGYVSVSKRRSTLQISQSLVHDKQIRRVESCFNAFSNRKLCRYERTSESVIRRREVTSRNLILYQNSNLLAHIYKFFTDNGLANILLLPDESLKAFLAGALDADGCVSEKHSTKKGKPYQIIHAEFLLSNEDGANRNFLLALRRFDCYGRIVRGESIDRIRITGRKDVLNLLDAVKGYSVKWKDIKTRDHRVSSASDKMPQVPVAQLCAQIAKLDATRAERGIWSTVYEYKELRRWPARDNLLKIKERMDDTLTPELKEQIDVLTRRDYFLDEITDITSKEYTGYVYDLYVPETHNFVCDGIFVHNCVDEFDKMTKEDRSAMHEALEQQTVSIAKAGIVTSLNTRTAVLAAANPKYGRFDPYRPISEQVELGPAILSRFDLKFPIKDLPSAEGDKAIAEHILKTFIEPKTSEPPLNPKFLRKYIAYARRHSKPKLTKEAMKLLEEFYVDWRTKYLSEGTGTVALTARQLEALVRLAEASARIRLDHEIRPEDTQRATKLLENSLKALGTEPETGKIDIDRIETGISSAQRSRIHELLETVKDLEVSEGKRIPMDALLKEAKERGMSQMLVEELIDKLKQKGDLYEPRPGYIQRP